MGLTAKSKALVSTQGTKLIMEPVGDLLSQAGSLAEYAKNARGKKPYKREMFEQWLADEATR
jgi:hypothetical protein